MYVQEVLNILCSNLIYKMGQDFLDIQYGKHEEILWLGDHDTDFFVSPPYFFRFVNFLILIWICRITYNSGSHTRTLSNTGEDPKFFQRIRLLKKLDPNPDPTFTRYNV